MSKEHDIALKTVNDKIKHHESFSWDSLQEEIIKNGGILRISVGYTVGEYITELEDDGILAFNPETKLFDVVN